MRERIGRYQRQGIGEQDTKAALIVPVLRALGWDVEDLEEVKLEYRRRSVDNPVDYALFVLRTPRLLAGAGWWRWTPSQSSRTLWTQAVETISLISEVPTWLS